MEVSFEGMYPRNEPYIEVSTSGKKLETLWKFKF